ncbi:major facilitator superfamily domain-containing protein 6 [Bicyclus anynana]|uniref:Major facilitator superfamily domain-containing protein 6 n=1 Tax=Bicyclus anynana TaxID=110368 RepID=A0ABM3M4I4_BICAN|nr:major facilitator superfamily domain-containing protein 6 [Bicyclus anynana]
MKFKIDRGLLPVKIHFFFFFAALGPLLPQINVFGKQLGVSPAVMGLVTAVLPLLWAAAKPLFGYIVDYWPSRRKFVFMMLILIMSGSYCCLWFLPMPEEPETPEPLLESVYQLNDTVYIKKYNTSEVAILEKYTCHWNCTTDDNFQVYLTNTTFINTVYVDNKNISCSLLHMDFDDMREGEMTCTPIKDCNLLCYDESLIDVDVYNRSKREIGDSNANKVGVLEKDGDRIQIADEEDGGSLYMTCTFWAFVILMCIGTVAFNVANCIGDAVCFDVLGPERGSKYGAQRAWGTAGYGVTALLGGWLIDVVSGASRTKDFTPAFIVAIVATAVDLGACRKLNLPSLSSPDDSGKALRDVLRIPRVLVFISFAVVVGVFDSFIIYYMFWFLEELAETTGSMEQIKLIEGVVVAAQSFIGELLFFFFSGKIIKRWGYGTTLTFCLFCYGVRLALISLIQHPWHLVFIEAVMQGPTYALCYAAIVGYAAHVAPEGYSATVQGIVAGMDDGVGFALGSLVGGQLYAGAGGRGSFRIFAGMALVASGAHALLFAAVTRSDKHEQKQPEAQQPEVEKMLPEDDGNAIYRPTVVPITDKQKHVDR